MLIKQKMPANTPIKLEKPSDLLTWLTYQNSLTALLKKRAGDARLEVLGQAWVEPAVCDRQLLQLSDETVLCREIIMWAWQEPCWYARTIIPAKTFQADSLFFDRLEKEPLGDLIYNEDRIKRTEIIHYSIDEQAAEYQWIVVANEMKQSSPEIGRSIVLDCFDATFSQRRLWVRKSTFTLNNKFPFYLVEILLPALARYFN